MKIELTNLSAITPYPNNPRVNDAAVEAVANSIREYGFRQPIVVDENMVVIVGHTRLKAAQNLGLAQVPVHVATDLSPDQIRAYRIADNQTATLAEWDFGLLHFELADLQAADYDLSLLAFDPEEVSRILDGEVKDGLTDPDDVPLPPDEAITQLGDLWVLGDHRLLCADSTKAADVSRLLDGNRARMIFTDPPWNVAIGQDSNPRHRQRRGLKNDDLGADFGAFLTAWSGACLPQLDGDLYCVMGSREWPAIDESLRQAGVHWSAVIVWVKDTFVLGRRNYHPRFEPIWYGWPEKKRSSFNGKRDLDDVWSIPRPKRSEEHPTMKPVQLVVRAILNSSRPGDLVFDPFGGSGTTLIAAEQTGRKAFLMEIDCMYADVIVQRWESFTGRKAERQSSTAETGAAHV